MILYKLTFGPLPETDTDDAEEAAGHYVGVLNHNGQTCGDYFIVRQNDKLCAYVRAAGIHAHSLKYHCKYGTDWLNKVIAHFGAAPKWELIDDEAPKRDATWTNARSLFLYTNVDCELSPLRRGDSGKPIPLYRLPDPHEDREAIYFWQREYNQYDSIFMRCGVLEGDVYRQMAAPDSALSQAGRKICKRIEKATGIPTYYYLMRHWGRRKNEEKRRCPGCGRAWRTDRRLDSVDGYWQFPFRCDKCRLVSHMANTDDDERHAGVGEWKKTSSRGRTRTNSRGRK